MYQVKSIDSKTWRRFLKLAKNFSFLNSLELHNTWKNALREKIIYRAILKDSSPILIYNIVKKTIKVPIFKIEKNFLFLPSSPLIINGEKNEKIMNFVFEKFFEDLVLIAKKEKSFFIKIEPMYYNSDLIKFLKSKNFVISKKQIEPQITLIIDLRRSQEEILKSFYHKARYNIKIAIKKGVKVKLLRSKKAKSRAIELIFKTAEEKKFGIFKKEYFNELFKNKNVLVFGAFYKNKLISVSVDFLFYKKAIYLFGGLKREYKSLMSPYLLKWSEISYFKKNKIEFYDLWGICDPKILNSKKYHPLKGTTQFKLKFDGNVVFYPGSFDFIIKKILYIFYSLKK